MPKNIDKRLPLNIDLDKLLLHYGQTPDTSAYEERKQRYAETRAKWLAENADRVNAREKIRAYKETHREEHKAYMKEYHRKRRCDVATTSSTV